MFLLAGIRVGRGRAIGARRTLLLAVLFFFLFSVCLSGLVVWIGKGQEAKNWEGKRTRVNSIVRRKREHCKEGGKKGRVGQGERSQGRKALIERQVGKAERVD